VWIRWIYSAPSHVIENQRSKAFNFFESFRAQTARDWLESIIVELGKWQDGLDGDREILLNFDESRPHNGMQRSDYLQLKPATTSAFNWPAPDRQWDPADDDFDSVEVSIGSQAPATFTRRLCSTPSDLVSIIFWRPYPAISAIHIDV